MISTVAVLVREPASPFEFAIACEVFGMDRSAQGLKTFTFMMCGEAVGQPLATTAGFTMTCQHAWSEADAADVVIAPSCRDTGRPPQEYCDALVRAQQRGAYVVSLCSGIYALAHAGLLDGVACTTHWLYADDVAECFPTAKLDPDVLYTHDGTIITSAGTAAGIDACLYLVRREEGSDLATAIARRMVVPPHRDGGQKQFIAAPVPVCDNLSLQPTLAWLTEHLADDHTVASMAARASMSTRTFARRFVDATGVAPGAWLTEQRVLRAQELLEQTNLTMEDVARSVGFGSANLLRHHFQRRMGVTPTAYRTTFTARS